MWFWMLGVNTAGAGVQRSVPLTIVVHDAVGEVPVPAATVLYGPEGDEHRVNTVTGGYETDVFYLPDGREEWVVPKRVLVLEIAAPGYLTERVTIEVKRRNNRYVVPLTRVTAW